MLAGLPTPEALWAHVLQMLAGLRIPDSPATHVCFKCWHGCPFQKLPRHMCCKCCQGCAFQTLLPLAVPHRASQIARCASQLRIAEPKSQETCHAVSNASHASLLTSPHRRHFAVETPHRREKWSPKTYRFHRSPKNSCKNEDEIKFGRSPWHEIVLYISL